MPTQDNGSTHVSKLLWYRLLFCFSWFAFLLSFLLSCFQSYVPSSPVSLSFPPFSSIILSFLYIFVDCFLVFTFSIKLLLLFFATWFTCFILFNAAYCPQSEDAKRVSSLQILSFNRGPRQTSLRPTVTPPILTFLQADPCATGILGGCAKDPSRELAENPQL